MASCTLAPLCRTSYEARQRSVSFDLSENSMVPLPCHWPSRRLNASLANAGLTAATRQSAPAKMVRCMDAALVLCAASLRGVMTYVALTRRKVHGGNAARGLVPAREDHRHTA